MKKERDPPNGRRFYQIQQEEDGTCTVYLMPDVTAYECGGFKEFDVSVRVVRGVEPYEGMEEDIRKRYSAWCELGEEVNL